MKLLEQPRRRAGLKPQRALDDQARYWSEQGQQWERQADEDIVAGQVEEFGSVDKLIADLDACGERWNHTPHEEGYQRNKARRTWTRAISAQPICSTGRTSARMTLLPC